MKKMKSAIVICGLFLFTSALALRQSYAKYTQKVNVGTVEISVVAQRRSALPDGETLNEYFRYWYGIGAYTTQKIVFDTYKAHPKINREKGIDIGSYSGDVAEEDKIRIYFWDGIFGSDWLLPGTVYVLSDRVIYAESCEGMFANCNALKSVEFNNFNTSGVKSMKDMFLNCRSLSKLDLSGFHTSAVTDMSGMFKGCSAMNKIYVSDKWNTQSVITGEKMFEGCIRLKGGAGTGYSDSQTSAEYARIDKREAPGYFHGKEEISG